MALLKNRYYTVINIIGLVLGMLSALIIAKHIGGSLQFDSFHKNKKRIYSISQEESIDGNSPKKSNATYWGVGEMIDEFPDVFSITRYGYHIESLIIADGGNGKSFFENKIYSVDSSFLNIFTFPLKYGNPKTALSRINSIVITNSTAQRYFDDLNPLGRTLTVRVPWGSETTYEITGVLEDVPQRSQFRFDFLTARATLNPNEY